MDIHQLGTWSQEALEAGVARSPKAHGEPVRMLPGETRKQYWAGWQNYGSYWHVDHIIPLASFDLRDSEQQKWAFHYSNCRPLEGSENLLKSDSIPDPHQALLI